MWALKCHSKVFRQHDEENRGYKVTGDFLRKIELKADDGSDCMSSINTAFPVLQRNIRQGVPCSSRVVGLQLQR
jgi:hypothetical protein